MKLLKRAAALLLSLSMLAGAAGCGEDTAYAMKVDGTDVRAGLYIYYAVNAYQDAMDVLRDGGEDFTNDVESKDIAKKLKNANINGKTAEEWIQDKAALYCAEYVAVEKEFEKQGLTLSGDELAQISESAKGSEQFFGEFFKNAGIGEQSVKDITASSLKQNALWVKYYGEGGIKDIKTEDLYDNYAQNHRRMKYITIPLKDGEGNLLKADGKEELKKMVDDYLARLAKKQDDKIGLMKEMDFLIDEHNNYVTSLSNAAVTTTDESGNTITTPTTPKLTTDEFGNTAATTEATTGSDGSTETTGTAAVTTAETTTGNEAEGAETTSAGENAATTTTTETTETTTTSYSYANEVTIAVSTSGSEKAVKEGETTAAPTYTPCEKVYNWVVSEDSPLMKPELIEDEECWYIVLKMDIKERMTSNDIWNTNTIENVRSNLYYKEFQDLMEKWGGDLNIERNDKAFRRYKVLDLDIKGYQNALMQSYYSMYNMSY